MKAFVFRSFCLVCVLHHIIVLFWFSIVLKAEAVSLCISQSTRISQSCTIRHRKWGFICSVWLQRASHVSFRHTTCRRLPGLFYFKLRKCYSFVPATAQMKGFANGYKPLPVTLAHPVCAAVCPFMHITAQNCHLLRLPLCGNHVPGHSNHGSRGRGPLASACGTGTS